MLRSKISIVIAPKVVEQIESIANANEIKSTEVYTILIEEMFIHKKEDLIRTLLGLSLVVPDNFNKPIESEEVLLPYQVKEIIIPDACPECQETEDILGKKVLYYADGFIHCKSCLAKFEAE